MGLFRKKKKNAPFASNAFQKTLHKNLEFTAVEQYKLLRTNLDFTLPEGEACPVIGVTSSMRGEGKSTTAINLSYVLAEKGSKVLLIDGDLRIPSVAKKMGINSSMGLTDILMGKGAQISDFQSELLNNWYILPSGEIIEIFECAHSVTRPFLWNMASSAPAASAFADASTVGRRLSVFILQWKKRVSGTVMSFIGS